ncbi:MAG: ABC transporter permease, partial [Candidatus Aminicenantes bacterium]|nr:ABC transporter permease [Candidatus Aminicenantes bacterium]
MLKNYLKIASRNIIAHKGHSAINIIGLAIGMAACILLFLWVQDELSYDRYHQEADRIYRVAQQDDYQGKLDQVASTPAALAPALVSEYPWIEKAIRLVIHKFTIYVGDNGFSEDILLTDPGIFQVFDFPLISGSPETVLKEPSSILISEDMRDKYFGSDNPVGEIITLEEWGDYKITGVFKNIPQNSHFRFHFMGSLHLPADYKKQWGMSNYYTYILGEKEALIAVLDETMPQFVEKYRGKELWSKYKLRYFLQPLTSIHLHSNLKNEIAPNRDIKTVYIFSAIAFFILLIACLNYINLATARFTNRAREVG